MNTVKESHTMYPCNTDMMANYHHDGHRWVATVAGYDAYGRSIPAFGRTFNTLNEAVAWSKRKGVKV